MSRLQDLADTVNEVADQAERFRIDLDDVPSAREEMGSAGTRIEQREVKMAAAAETLNRSFPGREESGAYTHVISPVVIPKDGRSYLWVAVTIVLVVAGLVATPFGPWYLPGPHYWLFVLAYAALGFWRNSFVMVPDGAQALITKFGKLETTAEAGRVRLMDPRKKVSYIVNTTKEYPYNAPIREAPTAGRVNASVDLFLQFRIEDPAQFIFTLGGVNGFSEKLENAVSELTRGLIYAQRAEAIYDLVGESTQGLLTSLNEQFLPAVRFVNANITHAEPSSEDYRRDLAAAEVVRVAKEAYTYQYQLDLKKQQDEGELAKDLASLQETLSEIRAEVAHYQAQIDTSHEKEAHRAEAYAHQLMAEVESEARANAALFEAQALDIRAMSSADHPEILEHRFRLDVLDKLEAVAATLPQVVDLGDSEGNIDFMDHAHRMLGLTDEPLYSDEELAAIRQRRETISGRVAARGAEIEALVETPSGDLAEAQAQEESPTETDVLEGGAS